ncbi:MAG: alpha-amylase family glycosyl hydrolase, partial [Janthinobacterium lividum]
MSSPSVHLATCVRVVCFLLLTRGVVQAQLQPPSAPEPITVTKIDPPNWYSGLPRPLLLVRGTGLAKAEFLLSDPSLHIQRTSISANGHWAQLELNASPPAPETIDLQIKSNHQSLRVPYHFAAPRARNDGMQGFSPRDVLYLIMTDRFADGNLHNDGLDAHSPANSPDAMTERAKPRGWHGGDLQGVFQHLDYLQQLGVTAVWITPVYTNAEPEAYHGYHATDYYGVDPHLGTLDNLQQLAKALHARGMKLVLDTVPNHVGPGHPWLTDEPTPEWFHGTREIHHDATFDFSALINPHAPERDRLNTLHGWFANALPDMDTDDPVVAQYLRQNAVWWIEQTGADALRIDTFAFVNRAFWHEFNGQLNQLFPHLTEVGEVFNPHAEIVSSFADGVTRAGVDTRLYTPFDFPTYFALRDVFAKNEPMRELAEVL